MEDLVKDFKEESSFDGSQVSKEAMRFIQARLLQRELKWCPKCHTVKSVGSFSKRSSADDKLQGMCKDCYKARAKKTKAVEKRENKKSGKQLKADDTLNSITRKQRRAYNKELFERGLYICIDCYKVLPIDEFYKGPGTPHGLECRCKKCHDIKYQNYGNNKKVDSVEVIEKPESDTPKVEASVALPIGWVCPTCGRNLNPSLIECPFCSHASKQK